VEDLAMRHGRSALVIGALAALLFAPTVAAAAPPVTTITIDVQFGSADPKEPFWATGGVVCETGYAITDPVFAAGFGRMGRGVGTFHLIKTLYCDDGSGTFQIRVDAATAPTSPGTIGGFAVVGGTGEYVGLHGAGSLLGTSTGGGSGILDVYTGILMN
jgi:hypothetical protein